MRIVIKLAGALLEDGATVRALAKQMAALARRKHELLVVHGGGRIFTNTLKRMGIESKFVGGLRVTDKETRDAAMMIFAGLLNKQVSGAITAEGQPAIGICAADSACFSAAPLVHNDVEGGLGYVGYLTSVNVRFLESLWKAKLVPVAACLGLGADHELYNINADQMAAASAEFIEADHLIYLTDVAGVLDGEKVLSAISCEQVDRLIHSRIVSGGMILKLEAAKRALQSGVSEVHIVGGNSAAEALSPERFITTASSTSSFPIPGTRVLREPLSAGQFVGATL